MKADVQMKITVLSSLPPQRGVTPYTMQLLRALAARPDVEVEALGFSSLYPRRLYPGGAPDTACAPDDVTMPVPAARTLTWYNPLAWLRAGLTVRGDVVHAQWWSWFLAPPYVVVLALARLRGKRVVVTVHNTDPHEGGVGQRLANRVVLRLAHRLIVHTEVSRRVLIERGVPAERIAVVPIGVAARSPASLLPRPDARRALGLAASSPLVLFFGNIRPYKGVEDLIEAFCLLREPLPEASLAIVGQPWRGAVPVADAIEQAGLGAVTTLRLDYVDSREMRLFIDASDVIVFPYRRFDAQSAAATEALAAGRAIIVTDVGGLPDLVRDRRAVVPAGNARALASALEAVLADDNMCAAFERDSRRIASELEWSDVAQRTIDIYRALFAGPLGSTAAPPDAGERGLARDIGREHAA